MKTLFNQHYDIIDRILAEELSRPGLIDWAKIDSRLFELRAVVDRRVLHKRAKAWLRSRPGVSKPDPTQKKRFW